MGIEYIREPAERASCYCCMATEDIREYPSGLWNATIVLCSGCVGAHFVIKPRFKGNMVVTFVCKWHGDKQLDTMAKYFYGIGAYNEKFGTRMRGIEYKLNGPWNNKIDWEVELDDLREKYKSRA